MHILEEITSFKRKLLDHKKKIISIQDLERNPLFEKSCVALTESIKKSQFGIIAEHKRRSPSKPHINFKADVFEVAKAYEEGVPEMGRLGYLVFHGDS